MTTLIKELLDFSKILHGDAAFEKTNLDAMMGKVINDFDLLISEKNAVVTCEQLPVIEAVPLQINQLFYNLLGNALKFSKEGSAPVITITARTLTPGELEKYKGLNPKLTFCEISIKDNGIGFEQQYAEQIFLIFNRLHGRHEFTGTGIGLALCKTIAVNHHGEIRGISNTNEGALFQVVLPLMQ